MLTRLRLLAVTLCCAGVVSAQDAKDASVKAAKPDKAALRQEAQQAVSDSEFDKAAGLWKQITELDPKDPQAWHMLGYSLHLGGKLDEALKVHLKTAEFPETKPIGLYNAACAYALKKDKDNALASLSKSIDAGFAQVDTLENDDDFASVRDDAEFKKLVVKAKAAASDPKKAGKPMRFTPTPERRSARYALFASTPQKGGQLAIEYGPVKWKDSYEKLVEDNAKDSQRWRFGHDFWTTLDTNVPLEIAGVSVPVGLHYLTLQRKNGKFLLQCHDSNEIRKQRLDAFMAQKLTGGIEVPCEHMKGDDVAERLAIKTEGEQGDPMKGTIVIRFGPHTLKAPFVVKTDG